MVLPRSRLGRSLPLAALASLASVPGAQFVIDNAKIPATGSFTENVDFADVDLDGDWDAALGDGGDDGNDQNRLWINQGLAQVGTLGVFLDLTGTQVPSFQDDSRDIEFVDFDDDGDPDIYASNTSQISNQGNRWWTNLGGQQAGSIGFYADETASRWIGLGGAGSSIHPSQLVASSFIDWSCDCDFGDLDNDGDLDLVHSSYGGSFGGSVPTRLFLNDGEGHFSEFNPSGFQLSGPTIANGNPGLWCDGTQSANTTNSTGTNCDIATTALDIDVGDIDGDFDLDILHGARNEPPRMFANRLERSTLAPQRPDNGLGFRDVTGAVYPPGYTQGTFGHYEQEMGDMDGDGDLDIYGLNWLFTGFAFDDITLRNNGSGVFANQFTLPGGDADDNEGDFFDYDLDGDLDLYIANFSGQDKLYRNNGGSSSYSLVSLPSFAAVSLDADCCDTDNDGDYDVLIAEDQGDDETFLRNNTTANDVTAPYLPNVEQVSSPRAARAAPIPVRVHVYDNAPYYITWYNDTDLLVEVDGVPLPDIQAKSSAGQIFRGELPGNLVGKVKYRFRSRDKYSNTGHSAWLRYNSLYRDVSPSLTVPLEEEDVETLPQAPPFERAYGKATAGAAGTPTLRGLSVPFAGSTLYLAGEHASAGTPFAILLWDAPLATPLVVGDWITLNAFGENLLFATGTTDAEGRAVVAVPVPAGLAPGVRVYGQFVSADGLEQGWAASQGLELTIF